MAIHDVNLDYATRIGTLFLKLYIYLGFLDQAHDLAWCLDACIFAHHIDIQQSAKLKVLLDKKKLTDEVRQIAVVGSKTLFLEYWRCFIYSWRRSYNPFFVQYNCKNHM